MLVIQIHTLATLTLTGLIWFVQVVHYPLFRQFGRDGFASLMAAHQRRTTFLVAPLMSVEAIAAIMLVARPIPGLILPAVTGLLLLMIVWGSTALLQVPAHRRLLGGYDRHTIDRLVDLNWVRTAAWTARAVVALALATIEVQA